MPSARFRFSRKSVNRNPSGLIPPTVEDQVYVLFTQRTSFRFEPGHAVFFSHISPVWLSVIVPSILSTNRTVGLQGRPDPRSGTFPRAAYTEHRSAAVPAGP